ncbi:MAG: Planctomycete cytochrome, partial [Bryobacterales bacterium]|nr:Planctomycete cytochrome [Bryobacterales bacterium]
AFRSDLETGRTKDVSTLSPVNAPVSPAWHFDGKRFLEINKDIANVGYLDPFTFSAWIKPEGPKGAILSQAEDYFEGTGHSVYVIDGKIRLHIVHRWTDLALRIETVKVLKLNEWQHVVLTYDGKRKAAGVRIYLDGEAQETKVLFDQLNEPFHVAAKTPFRIGAAGGLRFEGSIADVRVYKRALPANEAAALAARESVGQIAALPPAQRSHADSEKIALAFLEEAAPKNITKTRAELNSLRSERAKLYESLPTVMVMVDDPKARETFLLKRGAYDGPGEKVTPGIPEILPQPRPDWPNNRLGLARWLVDRSNPLTARVTVNRFWQSYFGFGIVKTVDDFGSQGEWPVHPELLDWLAVEFIESGWDVKAMQKLIVTSATYRQASRVTPELLQRDPDNRLLARGPRFRLGPEVIRDQALAASGLLVQKVGGPSVKPYQPPGLWQELSSGGGYTQDKGEGLYRRSLYTYWKRTVTPPFMANFDSPNREVCTVRENRTNTPLQALNLMNDVAFLEASRKLAERMMTEGGTSPQQRIDYGYELLLARPAKPAERRVLLKTFEDFRATYANDPKAAEQFLKSGESPRRPGLSTSDLAAFTTVANLMLNQDAAINKE